jgi:hypothetical protein
MLAVLLRLALLALGMGLIEIGLGEGSSPSTWLTLVVGLLFALAGTAGFMGPLLESGREKGGRDHE